MSDALFWMSMSMFAIYMTFDFHREFIRERPDGQIEFIFKCVLQGAVYMLTSYSIINAVVAAAKFVKESI